MKRTLIWIGALAAGAVLGMLGIAWIDTLTGLVATVYTRLFQLLAVPTIVLAVVVTLASMGDGQHAGRLFRHTLVYTLLTTLAAAVVAALLYWAVQPADVSLPLVPTTDSAPTLADAPAAGYTDHLLTVVPNNVVRPFLEGNVLSLLLLAFAAGIGLARMEQTANKTALLRGLYGLQELLFLLIRWLVWSLPVGIVAFAAQLAAQLSAGVVAGALARYVLVVTGAGALQFFVVLPLLLLSRGINPLRTLRQMSPALMMALFTKSSAATLPVTINSAEQRMGASSRVARFVLPICTTINMNGCAAFILVTSLFVMQQGGLALTPATAALWVLISVLSAVGNAGVPMGCYFLTFSLMSGIGAPVAVMGLILPLYTIIDMLETAENVWSDACICAVVNKEI